jgi:hypothetical protein
MQGAGRAPAAPPAELRLTADLLRDCRSAASAAAAELGARERELAALDGRWPRKWQALLRPHSAGCERATDAQAAAELRGALPSSAEPPSNLDGEKLEQARACALNSGDRETPHVIWKGDLAQHVREDEKVWLQHLAQNSVDSFCVVTQVDVVSSMWAPCVKVTIVNSNWCIGSH